MKPIIDKETAELLGKIALYERLILDLSARVAEVERRLSRSPNANQLVSETKAAELLGVSPQTLARFRKSRRPPIPMVHVEGIIRYRVADIERFISERTRGARPRAAEIRHRPQARRAGPETGRGGCRGTASAASLATMIDKLFLVGRFPRADERGATDGAIINSLAGQRSRLGFLIFSLFGNCWGTVSAQRAMVGSAASAHDRGRGGETIGDRYDAPSGSIFYKSSLAVALYGWAARRPGQRKADAR